MRFDVLAQVGWPSPELEAYYAVGVPFAKSGLYRCSTQEISQDGSMVGKRPAGALASQEGRQSNPAGSSLDAAVWSFLSVAAVSRRSVRSP